MLSVAVCPELIGLGLTVAVTPEGAPVTLSVTGGADLRESWAKPTAYGEGFAWPVLEQVNGGDGV